MKKFIPIFLLAAASLYGQEPAIKDEKLEKILQKTTERITKKYYTVKSPGFFVPEISVSTRFEGISLFSPQGTVTLGGTQTVIDIKFFRYLRYGIFRISLSSPFSTGGSHDNNMITYLINQKFRFGLYGGCGFYIFDKRSLETGIGGALSISILGGGEIFADNDYAYRSGGLELSPRFQYNFSRYFSLNTSFDIGWRVFSHKNFKSVHGLVFGASIGLSF